MIRNAKLGDYVVVDAPGTQELTRGGKVIARASQGDTGVVIDIQTYTKTRKGRPVSVPINITVQMDAPGVGRMQFKTKDISRTGTRHFEIEE